MTTIAGGVTNTTVPVVNTTLGGGLTLSGLANSGETNVFPTSASGTVYNNPVQNNNAYQFQISQQQAASDPFASVGASNYGNINPDLGGLINPNLQRPSDHGMDLLAQAVPDIGPPVARAQADLSNPIQRPVEQLGLPGGAPTSTGASFGPASVYSAPPEPGQTPDDMIRSLQQQVATLQTRLASTPAPPQGVPVSQQMPGQPQAAPQQAPNWWNKAGNIIHSAADRYNMAHHPYAAQLRVAEMNAQRAMEVARINAMAQQDKEAYQQDRLDQRQNDQQSFDHQEKDLDRKAKQMEAMIGKGLSDAQKVSAIGEFYSLPPGSQQRRDLANLMPDLIAHIHDPQDEKKAAEYGSAGANMKADIVKSAIVNATYGAQINKAMSEAKAVGLNVEKELATFSDDIMKKAADAKKASIGAYVAGQTAPADINSAYQDNYAKNVDNQFRGSLRNQQLQRGQVDIAVGQNNLSTMMAPQGATKAQQQAIMQGRVQMAGMALKNAMPQGNYLVPPPPPGTGAMLAPGNQQFTAPPPPMMMPGMYQQPAMQSQSQPVMMPQSTNTFDAIPQSPSPTPPVNLEASGPPRQWGTNLPLNTPRDNAVDENLRKAQLITTQLPGYLAKQAIGAMPGAIWNAPGQVYGQLKQAADAGDKAIGQAMEAGFQKELKTSISPSMRPESRGLQNGAMLSDPDLLSTFAIKSHGNQRWFNQYVQAAGWGGVNPTRQNQPFTEKFKELANFEKYGKLMKVDPNEFAKWQADREAKGMYASKPLPLMNTIDGGPTGVDLQQGNGGQPGAAEPMFQPSPRQVQNQIAQAVRQGQQINPNSELGKYDRAMHFALSAVMRGTRPDLAEGRAYGKRDGQYDPNREVNGTIMDNIMQTDAQVQAETGKSLTELYNQYGLSTVRNLGVDGYTQELQRNTPRLVVPDLVRFKPSTGNRLSANASSMELSPFDMTSAGAMYMQEMNPTSKNIARINQWAASRSSNKYQGYREMAQSLGNDKAVSIYDKWAKAPATTQVSGKVVDPDIIFEKVPNELSAKSMTFPAMQSMASIAEAPKVQSGPQPMYGKGFSAMNPMYDDFQAMNLPQNRQQAPQQSMGTTGFEPYATPGMIAGQIEAQMMRKRKKQ